MQPNTEPEKPTTAYGKHKNIPGKSTMRKMKHVEPEQVEFDFGPGTLIAIYDLEDPKSGTPDVADFVSRLGDSSVAGIGPANQVQSAVTMLAHEEGVDGAQLGFQYYIRVVRKPAARGAEIPEGPGMIGILLFPYAMLVRAMRVRDRLTKRSLQAPTSLVTRAPITPRRTRTPMGRRRNSS